jgi:hypothetical protein
VCPKTWNLQHLAPLAGRVLCYEIEESGLSDSQYHNGIIKINTSFPGINALMLLLNAAEQIEE